MKRDGFLTLTLRSGVAAAAVPAHLDCLTGAGRPSPVLDGGRIDALVRQQADGARFRRIFHARRSLGRPGEHHVGFDDQEEALGLSRSYQVELGNPDAAVRVRESLRDLDAVEQCQVQTLAVAPLDAGPTPARMRRVLTRDEVLEPQRRVRALEAMECEAGDASVTVAVVDTGVVVGHPEFQRRCLAGYDTVDLGLGRLNASTRLVGDSRGWDYNPYDEVGHGCLVAGIIGAQGFRVPRGLCGQCMLLPVRVLAAARRDNASGRLMGVGALPDIDAGIKVAVDLGALVINMSLGSPADAEDAHAAPPHRAVVRYAVARGCVLVAAAGNSGQRQMFYPAGGDRRRLRRRARPPLALQHLGAAGRAVRARRGRRRRRPPRLPDQFRHVVRIPLRGRCGGAAGRAGAPARPAAGRRPRAGAPVRQRAGAAGRRGRGNRCRPAGLHGRDRGPGCLACQDEVNHGKQDHPQ